VTEAEWLSETDPQGLLPFVRGTTTDRKLRLTAVASCRKVWHLMADDRSRTAVEIAELLAEGAANEHQRAEAEAAALEAARAAFARWEADTGADAPPSGVLYWAAAAAVHALAVSKQDLVDAVSDAGMSLTWSENEEMVAGPDHWAGFDLTGPWVGLVRDIIANPFQPAPVINPAWLAWSDGQARKLAESVYMERALPEGTLNSAGLALVADALEDAGCTDAELLGHLRGPGPHVRGCSALDRLLGKE
jgi:hypothetical protein